MPFFIPLNSNTVKLIIPPGHFVEGGSLPNSTCLGASSASAAQFAVAEVHVIFSAVDGRGVEHFLEDAGDERLPLEIQALAFDPKYASLAEALEKGNGKSVLGVSMLHKVNLTKMIMTMKRPYLSP